MKTIEEIYRERLAILIAEAGKSQAKLARALDKQPAQISQWLNASPDSKTGKPRVMSREIAREIEKKLGKPVGWMDQPVTAEDNPDWGSWGNADDVGGATVKDQAKPAASGETDIVIPQFDTGGAMGGGRLLLAEQPGLIKSWNVDHDWVRHNVKQHTGIGNLCIVTGFGHSMRPMYNPGDPLLLDTGVTKVDHEGVFFFRIGDEGFIKMLQRVPDKHTGEIAIRVISKNPDFPPYEIASNNPHFFVLGKILTVWKSEQY